MTLTGQQLGRYRLFEPLGSGGMSIVYKGLDASLEREVAVKVLHPHLATNAAARQRFAREARAVARLRHPNILEVFDVSAEDAPQAYLVTEYIRGVTLKDFLARHPVQVPEVAALIAHAIASALAHAHAAQVVHRDVKPENVMVREDGVLKLMDFGIAKVFDRDEGMTQTGTLVGSPAHMAPEIIAGEEAHYPADVFSTGTLLYLVLTGELPFQANNTPSLLQRILEGRYVDPRERRPAISDPLAEIVHRCLARQPSDRFADASALRDALADVLRDVGLVEPEEERLGFFADPVGYPATLVQRLTATRLASAEKHLAGGRSGRALADLGLLLALVPDHARGKELLGSLQRRARRRRRLARVARALVVFAALGGAVWGGLRWRGTALPSAPRRLLRAVQRPPVRTELVPGEPTLLASTPTATPARPAPGPAATPPEAPRLPVAILVRPYGYVRVDGGAPSPEALARHALELPPGKHHLTVSCDFCEDVGEDIEVASGAENVFHLRAQLKPAQLVFRFQPADARVRVGSEERRAAETPERPFRIESPRGPPTFRHRVEYEVTAQGFRTARRTVYLEPGKLTLVEGTLERS